MSAQHEEDCGFSRITEAPISSNFYWTFGTKEVFNVQTTIRHDYDPEKFAEYLSHLQDAMTQIVRMGGHAKPVGQQPAPVPNGDPAAKLAREAGNPEMAQELQDGFEAVPPSPDGRAWLTLDASRILITPQPDDRVNIEFFSDGHKFPDAKVNKWKIPQAAGLLKHVTSHDVTRPADLSVACRVYYTLGKEYAKQDGSKGNYKDIAHCRPR